jgi:aspartyl-tRNA synthetase
MSESGGTARPGATVPDAAPAPVQLEGLGDWRRTHTCGQLTILDAARPATLMGWVHRVRDHGGVIFVDLRDRYGLTQVVFRPESGGEALVERAGMLGNEWVIAARGSVAKRPLDSVNKDLATGEVELDARELKVLAAAAPLPFQVNEEMRLAGEDLRLRYRYLDLRRPELARNLAVRHQAAMAARTYLSSQSFLEIETPILVRPTPEGARDYVVPSRVHPGRFYALPQSPQLYKQVLMIAGCDRYFQVARCLRDEDLRADRQPEHTQIDLEMSFVTEDEVFATVEGLMAAMWRECLGLKLKTPFPRLTFREAMIRFGSDKPDLRFGFEFVDTTAVHARSPRNVIADPAKQEGGVGVALVLPGGAEISGTQLRKYEDLVKEAGGGGLTFFKVQAQDREKQQVVFPDGLLDEFFAKIKAQPGDAVLFTSGPWEPTLKALGVLRTQFGQPLLKGKEQEFAFLWVREFPLFEWDAERKSWAPRHHMFSMPKLDHLQFLESDPGRVHGQLYDVVVNGMELGSGSIRIHRTDIQERVMKVIGLPREEAYRQFGFLLEAYQFASPPHGGIGIGLERVVMQLAGRDSIRDVMAFPKTASAASLMDGCPAEVDPATLKELRIRVEG